MLYVNEMIFEVRFRNVFTIILQQIIFYDFLTVDAHK